MRAETPTAAHTHTSSTPPARPSDRVPYPQWHFPSRAKTAAHEGAVRKHTTPRKRAKPPLYRSGEHTQYRAAAMHHRALHRHSRPPHTNSQEGRWADEARAIQLHALLHPPAQLRLAPRRVVPCRRRSHFHRPSKSLYLFHALCAPWEVRVRATCVALVVRVVIAILNSNRNRCRFVHCAIANENVTCRGVLAGRRAEKPRRCCGYGDGRVLYASSRRWSARESSRGRTVVSPRSVFGG